MGNKSRTCMDDDQADTIGVWSGEMPSCERMLIGSCLGTHTDFIEL